MFQVRTGTFRQLEEAFLSDLLEQRRDDPLASLLVLSPSGHMLNRLQKELGRRRTGFLNIHFLTFYALAERLLSDAEYTESVVTEPALYQEMIRQILTGATPEAVDLEIRKALHLGGKPVPQGLAGALAATLKDLRDAGMRADTAVQAAQEGFLGVEAPEAASTLALYARLVGLFETHRLRSSADLLRRAAVRAPAHPWLKNQKAIFLYGFYDLTGVQLDLVLSLSDHSNTRVYFPYEPENPAYAYAEKLLKDPAFVSKCKPTSSSPAVTRRGPMDSPPTTAGNDGKKASVDVWSCSGARDEIWLAAKEILRLNEKGIAFEEIAIVARNVSAYLAPLRDIFQSNQIPFLSSRQEPAGSHPLMKTLRAFLTLDERHPGIKTLRMDLEKSPYVKALPFTATDMETQGSWPAHIAWATQEIQQHLALPEDADEQETALWKSILAALDELKILDAMSSVVTRRHFLEVLEQKLDALEKPGPAQSHTGVQVLEVQQARGLTFRALFLLGMNEKVFPRLIREDAFLSDAARSSLAQATGCRLGRKMDGYEEERLLFEVTRQAATDCVYLLMQRSDEEGKALIPSVYLKEIERLSPGLEPRRLPRSIADKFAQRSPLTWTPKELSFLINRAHLDPKELYTSLDWNVAEFYRLLAVHRAVEGFKPGLGPYDGLIEDVTLLKSALGRPFSPSSLEDLAECPYQYYAAHVLKITPPEEWTPGGEITHKTLGILFHRILELFYTACRDHGFPATVSKQSERLEQALATCLHELVEHLSTIYPLVIKSIKNTILKELSLFIKSDFEEMKESGYRPTWFEQPLEGSLPIPSLTHRFFGKPDRLDVRQDAGQTQLRVIDYKSGKPKPWTGRIETQIIQGRFLQLPIYLGLAGDFARKALGQDVTPLEATLRPVRETGEEATDKTLSAGFWQSLSAPLFAENIKELIGTIEKGRFYIEPSSGEWGYCTRCDFARLCRKEHMPTRLRAERDPLRVRVSEKLARTAPAKEPVPPKSGKKEKPSHVS